MHDTGFGSGELRAVAADTRLTTHMLHMLCVCDDVHSRLPAHDRWRDVSLSGILYLLFFPSGNSVSKGKPDGLNWPGRRAWKSIFAQQQQSV